MKNCFFALLVIVFWTVPAAAELNELPESDFTADSVLLGFDEAVEGANVADLYSRWGVVFVAGANGTPTIIQQSAGGSVNSLVQNAPSEGDSAGKPFILNFEYSVSRVAFVLTNADQNTELTFAAFSADGEELGTVTRNAAEAAELVRLGSDDPRGIAKLVISFGDRAEPETLDDLQIEYLQRPEFVTYLAQIADGPLGGGNSLQTSIVVTNLANSTAQGAVQFFNQAGEPLETLNLNSVSPILVAPFSAVTLSTNGESDPTSVGYAKVTTNVPVQATAIFRIVAADGSALTEAGVGSASPKVLLIGGITKVVEFGLDTGIAVVNVGEATSSGRIAAVAPNGQTIQTNGQLLILEPGEHTAAFFSEIFESLGDADFSGTVRISSDEPLVVVLLRAEGGLVTSSLPLGSTQDR